MGDLEPQPADLVKTAQPPVRASDADRERTAELLRSAGGRGQLDHDELEERLGLAFAARTREELVPLTADVPHDEPLALPGAAVVPGDGGEGWVVSVLSGNDRRGHWRVGPRLRIVNVLGGSEIDLSEAELTGPVTEITVVSVMGGGEIRVPDGAHVHVTRIGIMGGNDVKLGPDKPPHGAPIIRLRLIAVMGGNEVKRGRRLTTAERRERRIERRHAHDEKHLDRRSGR